MGSQSTHKLIVAMLLPFPVLFRPQLEFLSDTGRTDDASKLAAGTGESLEISAELLGLSTEELTGALLTRPLQVAREKFVKPNKVGEAQSARDALAKDVYLGIFNYLLKKINEATRWVIRNRRVGKDYGAFCRFGITKRLCRVLCLFPVTCFLYYWLGVSACSRTSPKYHLSAKYIVVQKRCLFLLLTGRCQYECNYHWGLVGEMTFWRQRSVSDAVIKGPRSSAGSDGCFHVDYFTLGEESSLHLSFVTRASFS